jgi:hypothetical protein
MKTFTSAFELGPARHLPFSRLCYWRVSPAALAPRDQVSETDPLFLEERRRLSAFAVRSQDDCPAIASAGQNSRHHRA